MAVGEVNAASVELCHVIIVPISPVKFNGEALFPQMVWLLVNVPPTDDGVTVTTNGAVVSGVQVPEVTTVLNEVVTLKLPGLYVLVLLLILIHPPPLLRCQNAMVPVVPLKVKLPGEVPEHTALVPLIVPAIGAGLTVINTEFELATAQVPL